MRRPPTSTPHALTRSRRPPVQRLPFVDTCFPLKCILKLFSTLQNGRRQSRAPSSPRRSTASRRSHGRTAAAKHVRSSPPPSSRLTMCHLPEEATTLAMVHRAARWARLAECGPGMDAVSQPGARDGAVLCISSCKRLSRSIDVCTSQRGLGYLRGWRRNWLDSSGSATQRSDQI